ncbi:MAG: hypothetical protein ACRDSL_15035, partial [Pseudonocardiaceae bacterium]
RRRITRRRITRRRITRRRVSLLAVTLLAVTLLGVRLLRVAPPIARRRRPLLMTPVGVLHRNAAGGGAGMPLAGRLLPALRRLFRAGRAVRHAHGGLRVCAG